MPGIYVGTMLESPAEREIHPCNRGRPGQDPLQIAALAEQARRVATPGSLCPG